MPTLLIVAVAALAVAASVAPHGDAQSISINMINFEGCDYGQGDDAVTVSYDYEGMEGFVNVQFFGRIPHNGIAHDLKPRRRGHPKFRRQGTWVFNNDLSSGVVFIERSDGTILTCAHWGDFDDWVEHEPPPCNAPKLQGVKWGTVWRTVNPVTTPLEYRGQVAADFVGANATDPTWVEEVSDGVCVKNEANLGQGFVGHNNANAFVNEVVVDSPCNGYGSSRFNGLELAVNGAAGSYLVVVTDAAGVTATRRVDAECDNGGWSLLWMDFGDFVVDEATRSTAKQQLGSMTVGSALVFDMADGGLLSSVKWGYDRADRHTVEVHYSRYDPDHVPVTGDDEEPWTFWPFVVTTDALSGADDVDGVKRIEVVGLDMERMADGAWVQQTDDACTPGEWNGQQSGSGELCQGPSTTTPAATGPTASATTVAAGASGTTAAPTTTTANGGATVTTTTSTSDDLATTSAPSASLPSSMGLEATTTTTEGAGPAGGAQRTAGDVRKQLVAVTTAATIVASLAAKM